MATKNIDLTLKWLLQSEWREKFIPSLGREPWITVYFDKVTEDENLGIFSALIPNAYVETSLSQISWDFHLQDGHPCFNRSNKNPTYLRFGKLDDVEPFIIRRDFHGIRDSYNEIIEEFRHFHRLYHDFEKNQLFKFDDRGDETVVAKLEMDKVEVHLKEVRQFLAVKEMHLAIYFDFKRYSELILDEFPQEVECRKDLTYYKLRANLAENSHTAKYKSFSYLCGKKLISPFPLNHCGMWPFNDQDKEDYIDFIIGIDEKGDSVKYSCNPDIPKYFTRVFFRREVLTKYYAHPERYSVEDGFLRCQGLWGLKLDNNHPEYITVFLGDLASLPSDEQIYWRSYNILPQGKMSKVNFERSFELTPAPPEQIDLMFKDRFVRFSKNWKESMGWSLFLELAESDQYLFNTLRIPLTNSQAEFDPQVLALTKVLIDSLNEGEIVKATPGGNTETKGISKFEQFLKAHQYPNYEHQIKFLRDLQTLRSTSVAHRKGDNYKKIAKAFGLKDSNRSDVLKKILVEVRDFLVSLERHFCE
ncbi:MAG: hypothetical protein F6K54_00010 [Okeania sp. SIO3B5]|uniref:hypothetical protein n=1 Tax=Okeania sp. SIO3B5 TaxID=2607811 RepID=UPI001400552E|nr:hypothetical protein [Okeania sp. SIO3B5]NEO51622.1 hypothetical protein [Okeania sp. SIO3B5]